MSLLKKIYKKLFLGIFENLKPKEIFLVKSENFLNIFSFFEENLPECHLFNSKQIPQNEKRYELLSQQNGTLPTEAYYLIKAINECLHIEGVFCEFGVAGGHTSALIANEIKFLTNKKLFLFDSFQGLPKPTKEDNLIDDIFNYGNIFRYTGAMKNPQRRVIKKLKRLNINKNNYKIFPGFVDKQFLENLNISEKVAFAYVDFDFYKPIKNVLEFLYTKTCVGSFIIVDDYDYFSSGVKLAVDNFLEKNKYSFDSYIAPKSIGNFIVIKRIK